MVDSLSEPPPADDSPEPGRPPRWQYPLWLPFVVLTVVAIGLGIWQVIDVALVETVKPTARAVGTGVLVGMVGSILLSDLLMVRNAGAGIAVAMIFSLAGGAVLFPDDFLLYAIGLVGGAILPAAINPLLIFVQDLFRGPPPPDEDEAEEDQGSPAADGARPNDQGGATSSPPGAP